MTRDIQHESLNYNLSEIKHEYGPRVHILSSPFLQSMLAQLARPSTVQPLVNKYVEIIYKHLLTEVVNYSFPREIVSWDTRMKEFTELGVFEGEVLKCDAPVICVDLARAGTWPSHVCFDQLNYHFSPSTLRQDHYYINRKVNDKGEVIGVDVSGSKIGGGQEDSIVLLPDPMGATGGSLSNAIFHYKNDVSGKAKRYIAMHLVVTPEYIKRMTNDHPDVEIFSVRLDRGMSNDKVLNSTPGTYPDEENGLNDKQYIVPGLGGVGEILNNSFV